MVCLMFSIAFVIYVLFVSGKWLISMILNLYLGGRCEWYNIFVVFYDNIALSQILMSSLSLIFWKVIGLQSAIYMLNFGIDSLSFPGKYDH